MIHRPERIVFVVALAGWLSCTGAPASDDASPDAPDGSANPDAHDGGDAASARDMGAETRPRDANPPDVYFDDAGSPEWTSIRGALPDFCTLERATHPERLNALRIHMWPCGVRDNCMQSEPLANIDESWIGVDGELAMGAGTSADGMNWLFVSPLDGGPPVAAYRANAPSGGSPQCTTGGAIGGGRVALVSYFDDFASVHGAAFHVAPFADAGTISSPILDDRAHFDSHSFPQGLYVSDGALVAWVSSGFYTDVSTGTAVGVYDAMSTSSVEESVSVVGDAILFQADGPATYLAIGQAGVLGGSALYHAGTGTDARVPHTDGIDVAWLQFPSGDPAGALELWTAAFTTSPTDFAPRHVRDLDVWTRPVVGAGMWVDIASDGTPSGPHHYELYDLASGAMRRYDMPDEIVDALRTLAVSSDRVIYPHGAVDGERLIQFDPSVLPQP